MAVSANLRVSDELREAFLGAQDQSDSNLRYLVVRIEAEVLTLSAAVESIGSAEEDFDTISGNVAEHEPSFVLFRRELPEDSEDRQWVLISYVPDTSKVRQKMLYASSKKDLLVKLGESLFAEEEFYVGEAADLTYEGFLHSYRKATEEERNQVLTAEEQVIREEALERGNPGESHISNTGGGGGGGGGAVPFEFDDAVKEAIAAFSAGTRACVEVKIHLKKEICMLGDLPGDTSREDLEGSLNAEEPRFYLLNFGKKVFVYCCPENSKVRSRMLYSTCRSTVIGNAREAGVEFDKTTEMREPSEIGDCLAIDSQSASAQSVKDITKVARKTRGKRRLQKKFSFK